MKWFLFFLFAIPAQADSFFKYGVGVFVPGQQGKAEVKEFSLGVQNPTWMNLTEQYEVGLWADRGTEHGRKSSFFGFYSLGPTVDAGSLYAQGLWGIGAISTTDSMLGGNFQFTQDLGLGLKDATRRAVGLNYKHVSSAGIYSPNKGRDFLTIKLQIPF
jgi:hypothetical protein